METAIFFQPSHLQSLCSVSWRQVPSHVGLVVFIISFESTKTDNYKKALNKNNYELSLLGLFSPRYFSLNFHFAAVVDTKQFTESETSFLGGFPPRYCLSLTYLNEKQQPAMETRRSVEHRHSLHQTSMRPSHDKCQLPASWYLVQARYGPSAYEANG